MTNTAATTTAENWVLPGFGLIDWIVLGLYTQMSAEGLNAVRVSMAVLSLRKAGAITGGPTVSYENLVIAQISVGAFDGTIADNRIDGEFSRQIFLGPGLAIPYNEGEKLFINQLPASNVNQQSWVQAGLWLG